MLRVYNNLVSDREHPHQFSIVFFLAFDFKFALQLVEMILLFNVTSLPIFYAFVFQQWSKNNKKKNNKNNSNRYFSLEIFSPFFAIMFTKIKTVLLLFGEKAIFTFGQLSLFHSHILPTQTHVDKIQSNHSSQIKLKTSLK